MKKPVQLAPKRVAHALAEFIFTSGQVLTLVLQPVAPASCIKSAQIERTPGVRESQPGTIVRLTVARRVRST